MMSTSKRSNIQTAAKGTLFLLLSLLLVQCSNNIVNQIDRSGLISYRPGFPEVTATAAGVVDELTDSTQINVSIDIVYRSLIFKMPEDQPEAEVLVEIELINVTANNDFQQYYEYPLKILVESQDDINSGDSFIMNEFFDASPGEYEIKIAVTDKNTDKQTIRETSAYIPNLSEPISNITNIRVFEKTETEGDVFNPVTSYDLSSELDSIRFSFQVTNNTGEGPLTVRSRLIKFQSDSLAARPMSWPNYTPSSLPFVGIRYNKYDIISTSTRIINQPGNVGIEFLFPRLERGNYRFEIRTDQSNEEELYRAREFSVKSKNYPSLRTPHELAAPLIYIMDKKEHERLMAISDPRELKTAIDRFWLSNLKNERIAQNVIELYYERVEEANKQFSNYKEGWKTDFGMMYILFGPPMYVFTTVTQTTWSYSSNLYDPETNFTFQNPKINNKYYPFDNYLLIRSNQYFNLYYQQTKLWLSGNILRDNL